VLAAVTAASSPTVAGAHSTIRVTVLVPVDVSDILNAFLDSYTSTVQIWKKFPTRLRRVHESLLDLNSNSTNRLLIGRRSPHPHSSAQRCLVSAAGILSTQL
jgi:hypothetical protein